MNKKKEFQKPEVDVIEFEIKDEIATMTSSVGATGGSITNGDEF